jgi:hypothetical protein
MIWYSLSVSVSAGATVIIAGVAHRSVLDRAMMINCLSVAHHLHLELFPPQHGFLDQDLVGGASIPRRVDLMNSALVWAMLLPVRPWGRTAG